MITRKPTKQTNKKANKGKKKKENEELQKLRKENKELQRVRKENNEELQRLRKENEELKQSSRENDQQLILQNIVQQLNETQFAFTPFTFNPPKYDYETIKKKKEIRDWEDPLSLKFHKSPIAVLYRISNNSMTIYSQRNYVREFFKQFGITKFAEFIEIGSGHIELVSRPVLLSFIYFCNFSTNYKKKGICAWESRLTRRGISEGMGIYNMFEAGFATVNNYNPFDLEKFKRGLYLAWVYHVVSSFVATFNHHERNVALNNLFQCVPASVEPITDVENHDIITPMNIRDNKRRDSTIRFKRVVDAHLEEYKRNCENNTHSTILCASIVHRLRKKNNNHVRFLRQTDNHIFQEIGDINARNLVGNKLRELYKSEKKNN